MLMLILVELYVIASATSFFVLSKLHRAYRKYRYSGGQPLKDQSDIPSVSVCLPARNETNTMSECLESVLASDYPKLEVIVLDDNSSDNTSHLIKAFAHGGVRFVAGESRPSDWLGKNFALETLLHEASGKYILFMDVDTRLSPKSISLMVDELQKKKATMLSVIPQRYDMYRPSAWFSTLRYFWELILDTKSSPGTSSGAWMIHRRTLRDEFGGFGPWRDEVQPESYIAREAAKTGDHQLIVSTPELGLSYAKKWLSQVESSRRVLLPRFNNSIMSVLVGVGLLCVVVLPQIIIIVAVAESWWSLLWAQIPLGVMLSLIFAYYCKIVWRSRWWIGLFVGAYVTWQELFLMVSSVVGYKRGTITWKGRVIERPTYRQASE